MTLRAWPKAVLFDLDGTLVDSLPDLAAAVERLFAEEGLAPPDRLRLAGMMGDGIPTFVARAFAAVGAPLPADAVTRFTAFYAADPVSRSRCYPGIGAMLERLAGEGRALGVCTNKRRDMAVEVLRGLGLHDHFQVVAGGDSYPAKKPDPRHVLHLLEEMGYEAATAAMVGDGANDLHAAHAAGLPLVLCRWGYSAVPIETLAADALVGSATEIVGALDALARLADDHK